MSILLFFPNSIVKMKLLEKTFYFAKGGDVVESPCSAMDGAGPPG